MPLQGTVETKPIGVMTCPVCNEYRTCIHISFKQENTSQGVTVCTLCTLDPGISFDVKVRERTQPSAAVKRRTRKRVKKEEEQTAKEIGGRTTFGSGSLFQDGDVKNEHWMVEEKSRQVKNYTIKDEVIAKALLQASRQGKNFVLKVRTMKRTLGILLWQDLLQLIKESDE